MRSNHEVSFRFALSMEPTKTDKVHNSLRYLRPHAHVRERSFVRTGGENMRRAIRSCHAYGTQVSGKCHVRNSCHKL